MKSFFTIILAIFAAGILCTCSNSEYVDEFDIFTSIYTSDDETLDGKSPPDTLNDFPPSGFYAKPFTVVLSEKMNCETGGFAPTKKSRAKKIIHIDTSSTIRCANLSKDKDTSLIPETIRTYLFEKKTTIPAIFITTDPNSLFNPDTGIYMDGPNAAEESPHYGANYWQDKEIPIFIELIETNAAYPAFSKHAGLKIFGNYSRQHPKKSVAITFRKKYGENRLNYPLFPEYPNLTTFKSFILRNFGNGFSNDYIRDRLASSISEGLNVDYQRGRCVIVFYNGKYFGIHDMRERSNEYYFETHYEIDPKNINLLKAGNYASAGSADDYKALMNWISQNSLESNENYGIVSSQIDINNYINYMQIEMFADNRDWPGNNLKKWNRSDKKTRWKWFLYDLDLTFESKGINNPKNIFRYVTTEKGTGYINSPEHTFLCRNLLKNKQFKATFINRMAVLLQMNFESSKILSKIEIMMSEIKSEIPRDQKRWSTSSTHMSKQLEIIKEFSTKRQAVILSQLQEYFKLGKATPITLSTKGPGKISVHGLPLNNSTITVDFFENFPVSITAEPQMGGVWLNWSDGDTNSTRTVYPGKDSAVSAIFK